MNPEDLLRRLARHDNARQDTGEEHQGLRRLRVGLRRMRRDSDEQRRIQEIAELAGITESTRIAETDHGIAQAQEIPPGLPSKRAADRTKSRIQINKPADLAMGSSMGMRVPRFTLDGVHNAETSVHPFSTGDGLWLYLTRFQRPGGRAQGSGRDHGGQAGDVVLLIHGLASSSDMFILPEQERNLVTFLLDSGFEAWTLDFRMSGRLPYDTETHRYTVDDVAKYDHPAALRELRRHVGDRPVHVIAHCLGSMSFAMSLAAGTVDGITSMISNGVALIPQVPRWSRLKLTYGPAILEYLLGFSFLDPRYATAPAFTRPWLLARLVDLFHRECDVRTCHMLSFMWGSGRPSGYVHDSLLPETHERIADLCSATGAHYYRHISKMVRAGRAVKYDPGAPWHADLPDDYLANAGRITTPILFLTGDQNRVFIDSNVVCHKLLSELTPGLHQLEIIAGYGHHDMVMGRHSHRDVFPRLLDFLRKHSGGTR